MKQEDIYILAIESSCDETAAAVVKNGREVLSNVIFSQIELHKLYGGVVPEIASRKHIEKINQVIGEALSEAKMELHDMTAIAVTYGPGLVGAGFRLSACTILRVISAPIILKIRIWSRPFYVWSYRADIRILLWSRIMANMKS